MLKLTVPDKLLHDTIDNSTVLQLNIRHNPLDDFPKNDSTKKTTTEPIFSQM